MSTPVVITIRGETNMEFSNLEKCLEFNLRFVGFDDDNTSPDYFKVEEVEIV